MPSRYADDDRLAQEYSDAGVREAGVRFPNRLGEDKPIVRKFWLLDQHGQDGPTALVQTDGRMRVEQILAFGPGITELADQQAIQDRVMGKVAPTLKPLVDGASIDVESVEPHADLSPGAAGNSKKSKRAARRSGGKGGQSGGGRVAGGPSRSGSTGDR